MNVVRGYRVSALPLVLCMAALVPFCGLFVCTMYSIGELALEARYRRQFGSDWQAVYEADWGSLSKSHTRVTAAIVGGVAIIGLMA